MIFCLLLWVCIAGTALAQNGASVFVRLSDPERLPVSNAAAVLWPGGIAFSTNVQGCFEIDELAGGLYRIEISAPGYQAADTVFTLNAGQRLEINLTIEELAATLREVVVEANAPSAAVQTVTRRDIEAHSARDLSTLLSSLGGVEVRDEGGPGSTKTVRIGGSSSSQVLVRVDGRKLQEVGGGEADLSSIPLEWIENIAVYRGAQAESGGEAIGGIVEITTRNPIENDAFSLRTDVHTTYNRTGFFGSGDAGPFTTLLCFDRTIGPCDYDYRIVEDDGVGSFTANLGEIYRRENNDLIRDQLFSKIRMPLKDNDLLEVSGTFDRMARGMPGYLAPQLTPEAKQQSQQESVNIRAQNRFGKFRTRSRISHQHDSRSYVNSDPFFRLSNSESSRRIEGEFDLEVPIRRHRLTGGLYCGNELLLSPQITGNRAGRTRAALWTKSTLLLLDHRESSAILFIEPGLRGEFFDTNQKWLPQVTIAAKCSPFYSAGLSLTAGQSYRAPSLYSLFWLDEMATRGNPDLAAETSSELTGRVYFQTASRDFSRIDVSSSLQEVRNLIYWKRTFDNFWKPFNLGKARIQTLDISAEQLLWNGILRLTSGVNWTEARDATNDRNTGGKYLTFRAPRSYRAGISLLKFHCRISSSLQWVSRRAVLETNSKWLQSYAVADLLAAYTFSIGGIRLESTLGIENLTNEDYRIVRYAPMPLRQWYAGIRISRG